jgi:formate hydrogenlyase transcriptional activator
VPARPWGEPLSEHVVGKSVALNQVLAASKQLASSDAAVLITGEIGSGKELVARVIHSASSRSSKNFVKVDCITTPHEWLERELFGFAKGAFDGAVSDKTGWLELANRGTLFVNEIRRFPLDLQLKLVRALTRGECEPLGSTRIIRVDVRLMATARQLPQPRSGVNMPARDLEEWVGGDRLQQDLYEQFKGLIPVPPLRERREDIPLLVRYFVEKFARRADKDIEIIEPETMDALRNYDWPGNVGQLESFIQRSVILTDGPKLRAPLHKL